MRRRSWRPWAVRSNACTPRWPSGPRLSPSGEARSRADGHAGAKQARPMKFLRVVAVDLAVLLGLAVMVELAFGEWIAPHPLGRLAIPRNVKRTISAAPLYPGGDEFVYQRDAYGLRGSGVDP